MFPGLMTTLQTTDPYLISLLSETDSFDGHFLVSLMIKDEEYFHQTCCLSKLEEVDFSQPGMTQVTIRGMSKFFVDQCPSTEPVIFGEGKELRDYYRQRENAEKDALSLGKQLKRYIFLDQTKPDAMLQAVSFITDPNILTNFCCHYFIEDPFEKQSFLESLNVNKRLSRLKEVLERMIREKMRSHSSSGVEFY
jgi:ATP-dependent Lon protease